MSIATIAREDMEAYSQHHLSTTQPLGPWSALHRDHCIPNSPLGEIYHRSLEGLEKWAMQRDSKCTARPTYNHGHLDDGSLKISDILI